MWVEFRMAVSSGAVVRAWTLPGVVLAVLALAAAWQGSAGAAIGVAKPATKTIHFRGQTVEAPASWPVIRLAQRPRTCVRLDRRAVYLGSPRPEQRCPASAVGRRRAILVDPGAAARASRAGAEASHRRPARATASQYTGLGFDACAAPSRRAMKAWAKSPYRAIGVYIGGVNRACSQPNLTASWVAEQIAAGWHLIPTYVGLQATTSSCSSCAKLSPSAARLQGAAAADDAVADARRIGLGPGSPIYNDMESYTRTAGASQSTLTFLAGWTSRLHALGYDSGVYSSSSSGIRDLVSRLGTLYPQPDDLWIANWNGRRDTADPYVPASAWSDHQRIHQYRGGHNETWGGVTINIDNNYVEGATAGATTGSLDDPKGAVELVESPAPGQVRVAGWAFDPNAPRKAVSIRVQVSAVKGGGRGGGRHELGAIASQPRADVTATHRRAAAPGFDATLPIVGSGRQRICVQAIDIGRGSDRELGCRTVGVRVPVTLSEVVGQPNSVRVRVRCEWPAGTQCPGQLLLRSRFRVRVPAARRGARRKLRARVVRRSIGRRSFRLVGGRSHTFRVALHRGGRRLTLGRRQLRAQLVVAIPGGRKAQPVKMR